MKRILITGAAGFIGRHLTGSLGKNKNISLKAFDKNIGLVHIFPDIKTIIGDIRDQEKLREVFIEEAPEIIIHLAAVIKSPHKEDYIKINVHGTENLVNLAENFGVKKFIFLSTDYVLYNLHDLYGESKRRCEEIIQSSSLNFTIFRPTPVLGPGDTKNFATLISIIKKYPIIPAIKCRMEPVYVGDVVKMIVASLENSCPPRRAYNLPGGSICEFPEIVGIISNLLGLKRAIVTLPEKIFMPALKIYESLAPNPLLSVDQVQKWTKNNPLNASLAKKDLNYNPISFEEGIRLALKE